MRDNLLIGFARASDKAKANGLQWYPRARKMVRQWARADGLSVSSVACIIAALSPQVSWPTNVIAARSLLDDIYPTGPLRVNISKAQSILAAARYARDSKTRYDAHNDMLRLFPEGPKVNSFAYNLAGNDTFVTVDTHAIQAALNDARVTIGLRWLPYRVFAECYAQSAVDVGLSPATFQAIVWHYWKERYPAQTKKQIRRMV